MCESRRVPYVDRGRVTEPPNYQEKYGALTVLNLNDGLDLIRQVEAKELISSGAAGLASGLLTEGYTMQFGTPERSVLGIDFSAFGKKPTVKQNVVGPANQEVADRTNGVHAIVGIAHSGIPLMEAVGAITGKQTVTVHKQNGTRHLQDGDCAVVVPGFTSEGDRVFSYDTGQLLDAFAAANGILPAQVLKMAQRDQLDLLRAPKIKVTEDIFHTGTALEAIAALNERAWQSMGIRLNVAEIDAWFGMTYAGYERKALDTFGILPQPVLKVKSLGVHPKPWIEFDMPGFEGFALTYARSDQE